MSETPHPIEMEEERIEVPDIAPAFAPDGMVARALGKRYRYRAGQAEMAQLVRQALIEGRTALIEAGTGSGKSFAYLIPVIASGARAFVSTANKTLQTQLWEKDIPTLQKVAAAPVQRRAAQGAGELYLPPQAAKGAATVDSARPGADHRRPGGPHLRGRGRNHLRRRGGDAPLRPLARGGHRRAARLPGPGVSPARPLLLRVGQVAGGKGRHRRRQPRAAGVQPDHAVPLAAPGDRGGRGTRVGAVRRQCAAPGDGVRHDPRIHQR